MGFIELMIAVKNAHSIYSITDRIFVDKTQRLMNHIGSIELSSAIRTLNDIPQSSNPMHEMHSVITQLRLAMEAFPESSEKKHQTALLIAICYMIVGDDYLSNKFKSLSIEYFDRCTYIHQQGYIGASSETWNYIRNEGLFGRFLFDDDHLEKEYGITWTGPGGESLASKILSVFKEKSYNERFREGVESTKRQYRQMINKFL